jgi:hypothetical protein
MVTRDALCRRDCCSLLDGTLWACGEAMLQACVPFTEMERFMEERTEERR